MPVPALDVPTGAERFATTHWSVVLTARDGLSPGADEALERLCRVYWPPLYSYIRREGHGVAEAQDLTQEFFARVLARDYLARWDQERGKFRSFLLGFLKHFLLEQRGKSRAQKRGGGWTAVSLDGIQGEEGYLAGLVDDLTPDQIFDRRWAQTIVQRALQRLAAEYTSAGRAALFEALKDYQPRAASSLSYAQIAAALGMTEPAVKSAMQRLRQRHRDILREEIAQTLSAVDDLEEEIRFIRELMTR